MDGKKVHIFSGLAVRVPMGQMYDYILTLYAHHPMPEFLCFNFTCGLVQFSRVSHRGSQLRDVLPS